MKIGSIGLDLFLTHLVAGHPHSSGPNGWLVCTGLSLSRHRALERRDCYLGTGAALQWEQAMQRTPQALR